MIRVLAAVVAVAFLAGCAVMPVSYVPTEGKVGSQRGRACVFKLLGLIPLGDEMGQLAQAADAAGNPTKDVAVIASAHWLIIGTNHCVTVLGSK
jgi:hypothetical protein